MTFHFGTAGKSVAALWAGLKHRESLRAGHESPWRRAAPQRCQAERAEAEERGIRRGLFIHHDVRALGRFLRIAIYCGKQPARPRHRRRDLLHKRERSRIRKCPSRRMPLWARCRSWMLGGLMPSRYQAELWGATPSPSQILFLKRENWRRPVSFR
jgi:hypothetical protein